MKLRILVPLLATVALAACSEESSGSRKDTPTPPAWTPTGELVYVALPPVTGDDFVLPVLHTINADGSGGRKLPLSAYDATWSHDGTRMLVNAVPVGPDGPWRPAVVDPDGNILQLFRLPDLPEEINNCHWTPDEKDVVCAIDGVVSVDLATGKSRTIARGGEVQVWDVSADGRVAFIYHASESYHDSAQLWTVNIDGSGKRQLTEYGELDGSFDDSGGSWLPDGSALVAATPDGTLVRIDAATGELTEIPLDEPLFASHPAVSPDGTQVAFQAQATGGDIYVTPIDGGPVALVVGTPDDERRAEWRPSE